MTLNEIAQTGGGWLIVASLLIQISPIKLNPWSWLAKWFGKAINGEVLKKVDNLSKDLENLKNDCDKREADQCRIRILRFNDELIHGLPKHTKEHFEQTIGDIDIYEKYCETHPGYKNHIADDAINRIKRIYKECGDKGSFL